MDQDGKFFSKLLSKDTSSSSSSSPSFRVYYGVPFMWESKPGTSKYTLPTTTTTTTTLPPLTPPPSFYTNQITKITRKSSTANLFKSMLPKLTLKKTHASSSSSPSSLSFSSSSISSLSSSSSSFSLFSSTSSRRHSRFSSARMSFSSFGEDEDHLNENIPLSSSSSSLCFPLRSPYRRNGKDRRGCVKKSFLSIVSHRSSHVIA